jgi:hypothetical protein
MKISNIAEKQKNSKPNFDKLVIKEPEIVGVEPERDQITRIQEDSKDELSWEMDYVNVFMDNHREKSMEKPLKGMNGRRFHNIYGTGPKKLDIYKDY